MVDPFESFTFEYDGHTLGVDMLGHYMNGRPRLIVVDADADEQYATLTVNLPDADLATGEIHVKVWSENAAMVAAMKAEPTFDDLFIDQGVAVPTGWTEAETWLVVPWFIEQSQARHPEDVEDEPLVLSSDGPFVDAGNDMLAYIETLLLGPIERSCESGVPDPGHMPYDPDDDSTKTPERGYR